MFEPKKFTVPGLSRALREAHITADREALASPKSTSVTTAAESGTVSDIASDFIQPEWKKPKKSFRYVNKSKQSGGPSRIVRWLAKGAAVAVLGFLGYWVFNTFVRDPQGPTMVEGHGAEAKSSVASSQPVASASKTAPPTAQDLENRIQTINAPFDGLDALFKAFIKLPEPAQADLLVGRTEIQSGSARHEALLLSTLLHPDISLPTKTKALEAAEQYFPPQAAAAIMLQSLLPGTVAEHDVREAIRKLAQLKIGELSPDQRQKIADLRL